MIIKVNYFVFSVEMILSPTENSQSSIGATSTKAAQSNASSSSSQPASSATTTSEPPVNMDNHLKMTPNNKPFENDSFLIIFFS